jgi:hypothetical protein
VTGTTDVIPPCHPDLDIEPVQDVRAVRVGAVTGVRAELWALGRALPLYCARSLWFGRLPSGDLVFPEQPRTDVQVSNLTCLLGVDGSTDVGPEVLVVQIQAELTSIGLSPRKVVVRISWPNFSAFDPTTLSVSRASVTFAHYDLRIECNVRSESNLVGFEFITDNAFQLIHT